MKRLCKVLLIILLVLIALCLGLITASKVPMLQPEPEATVAEIVETEPPTTAPPTTQPPETEPPVTEPPTTEPTEPPPLQIELPEPENSDFVRVKDYIPDIMVELRYATENNFTGQVIYEFDELWLRYGTVKKLSKVQETLRQQGMGLKVWDGFRPVAAQFTLWEVCPNATYVANPNGGYSSHSRGNTIDLTVVYEDGTELTMPTGFDDFSKKANRNYSDVSKEAAQNSRMLESIMKDCGFSSIHSEWWHFVDTTSYAPEKTFQPVADLPCMGKDGAIAFWSSDDDHRMLLSVIPADKVFPVIALDGDYVLIQYRETLGYVQAEQVKPAE